MPNNNLPPGWGNRTSSAKPDWENLNKESINQKNETKHNPDLNTGTESSPASKEKIQKTPKAEFTVNSSPVVNSKKSEKIKTKSIKDTPVYEQPVFTVQKEISEYTKETPKKSKAPVIILIILLVITIIVLVIFVFLYFNKDKSKDNIGSVSDNISTVVIETSKTDIATTEETTTTAISTTSQVNISNTEITTTTIDAAFLNEDDYIGFWHPENNAESELTIHSIDSSSVTFSLWYYRIWSIENLTATFERNSAYFYDDEIEGILTFDGNSIRLYVTMSNIPGIPSQYEEVYNMRIDESVQYGNGTQNPIGELKTLRKPLLGQINCHGGIVPGYTTSYVCDGGTRETVRQSLGDTWHVTAKNVCINYGITWYELWDSDDGDYYGWVDSSFIDFYT